MAQRIDRWPQGAPCWVDITVPDLDRSQDFYAHVLGWRFTPADPEHGGYCTALVHGEPVAGMSCARSGTGGDARAWAVYLESDDIGATGSAAVRAGAQQLHEPVALGSFGTAGAWTDPTGAVLHVWQPGDHTGFSIVGDHGTVAWCDLLTTDQLRAEQFYAELFGYTYQDVGTRHEAYAVFSVPGMDRTGGGIGVPSQDMPAGPPMWWVCFEVDDADVAAQRVVAAGGALLQEPEEFGYGELVLAAGPDGERFAMTGPSSQDRTEDAGGDVDPVGTGGLGRHE